MFYLRNCCDIFLSIAGCAGGMVEIGKIAFSPKEVLGRGSEGTFVYRLVSISVQATRAVKRFCLIS